MIDEVGIHRRNVDAHERKTSERTEQYDIGDRVAQKVNRHSAAGSGQTDEVYNHLNLS